MPNDQLLRFFNYSNYSKAHYSTTTTRTRLFSLLSEKNSTILLERTQLHFPPRRDYFKMREAAASVTLTGARALVVRGGDGGKDSTGSGGGGVALLAIPRTPCPRGRGLDARIR